MKRWKKSLLLLTATGMLFSSAWASALAEEKEEGMLNFDLDQVVVTATKTEKALKDVPASVTVITSEQLERANVQSLDEALQYVAGVHIKPELGSKATIPSMRGMRLGNILIMLDGMPINNTYNGSYSFADIPMGNIERVEVTRGSFSALYGSNAMAGVINVITKTKPDGLTTIRVGAGTHNRKIASLASNGQSGKLDYFVNYYKNKTDGYRETENDADGRIAREVENYDLKLTYNFTDQERLSLMASRTEKSYNYENSVVGNERESDNYNLSYQKQFNEDVNMNVRLSYRDSSGWVQTSAIMLQDMPMKVWDGDINGTWKINDRHILTVGASYKNADATGGETYMNKKLKEKSGAKTKTAAFYLQDEIKLNDRFTWYVGGRYDYWKLNDAFMMKGNKIEEIADHSESQFSPKTSFDYKASDKVTLYASVGQSFNSPNIISLVRYWNPNPTTVLAPTPDLKPERLTSYEIGANIKANERTAIKVAVFRNDIKDLIEQTGSGKNMRWDNIDKATTEGLEVEVSHNFNTALSGFFNYTYTDSKIDKYDADPSCEGRQLRMAPENAFNLGLNYSEKKWNVNLVGGYTARMYDSFTTKQVEKNGKGNYEPHFVVDAKVMYRFNDDANVAFSVNNLLNKEYYQSEVAPGTTYLLEFTQKF